MNIVEKDDSRYFSEGTIMNSMGIAIKEEFINDEHEAQKTGTADLNPGAVKIKEEVIDLEPSSLEIINICSAVQTSSEEPFSGSLSAGAIRVKEEIADPDSGGMPVISPAETSTNDFSLHLQGENSGNSGNSGPTAELGTQQEHEISMEDVIIKEEVVFTPVSDTLCSDPEESYLLSDTQVKSEFDFLSNLAANVAKPRDLSHSSLKAQSTEDFITCTPDIILPDEFVTNLLSSRKKGKAKSMRQRKKASNGEVGICELSMPAPNVGSEVVECVPDLGCLNCEVEFLGPGDVKDEPDDSSATLEYEDKVYLTLEDFSSPESGENTAQKTPTIETCFKETESMLPLIFPLNPPCPASSGSMSIALNPVAENSVVSPDYAKYASLLLQHRQAKKKTPSILRKQVSCSCNPVLQPVVPIDMNPFGTKFHPILPKLTKSDCSCKKFSKLAQLTLKVEDLPVPPLVPLTSKSSTHSDSCEIKVSELAPLKLKVEDPPVPPLVPFTNKPLPHSRRKAPVVSKPDTEQFSFSFVSTESNCDSDELESSEPEEDVEKAPCVKVEKAREDKYRCKQCKLSFQDAQDVYEEHMKTHASSKFFCEKCHTPFWSQRALTAHTELCSQPVICSFCSADFCSADLFASHLKSVHFQRSLKCPQCRCIFPNPTVLYEHISTRHKGRYFCRFCPADFRQAAHLRDHTRLIHYSGRVFLCRHCFAAFNRAEKWKTHASTHSGEYVCNECKELLSSTDELIKHVRELCTKRVRCCLYCPAKFRQESILKLHTALRCATNGVELDLLYDYNDKRLANSSAGQDDSKETDVIPEEESEQQRQELGGIAFLTRWSPGWPKEEDGTRRKAKREAAGKRKGKTKLWCHKKTRTGKSSY